MIDTSSTLVFMEDSRTDLTKAEAGKTKILGSFPATQVSIARKWAQPDSLTAEAMVPAGWAIDHIPAKPDYSVERRARYVVLTPPTGVPMFFLITEADIEIMEDDKAKISLHGVSPEGWLSNVPSSISAADTMLADGSRISDYITRVLSEYSHSGTPEKIGGIAYRDLPIIPFSSSYEPTAFEKATYGVAKGDYTFDPADGKKTATLSKTQLTQSWPQPQGDTLFGIESSMPYEIATDANGVTTVEYRSGFELKLVPTASPNGDDTLWWRWVYHPLEDETIYFSEQSLTVTQAAKMHVTALEDQTGFYPPDVSSDSSTIYRRSQTQFAGGPHYPGIWASTKIHPVSGGKASEITTSDAMREAAAADASGTPRIQIDLTGDGIRAVSDPRKLRPGIKAAIRFGNSVYSYAIREIDYSYNQDSGWSIAIPVSAATTSIDYVYPDPPEENWSDWPSDWDDWGESGDPWGGGDWGEDFPEPEPEPALPLSEYVEWGRRLFMEAVFETADHAVWMTNGLQDPEYDGTMKKIGELPVEVLPPSSPTSIFDSNVIALVSTDHKRLFRIALWNDNGWKGGVSEIPTSGTETILEVHQKEEKIEVTTTERRFAYYVEAGATEPSIHDYDHTLEDGNLTVVSEPVAISGGNELFVAGANGVLGYDSMDNYDTTSEVSFPAEAGHEHGKILAIRKDAHGDTNIVCENGIYTATQGYASLSAATETQPENLKWCYLPQGGMYLFYSDGTMLYFKSDIRSSEKSFEIALPDGIGSIRGIIMSYGDMRTNGKTDLWTYRILIFSDAGAWTVHADSASLALLGSWKQISNRKVYGAAWPSLTSADQPLLATDDGVYVGDYKINSAVYDGGLIGLDDSYCDAVLYGHGGAAHAFIEEENWLVKNPYTIHAIDTASGVQFHAILNPMQPDDGTASSGLVRLNGAVGVYGEGRAFYKVENGSVSKISDHVAYAAASSRDGSVARWIWGADEISDPRVGVDDEHATSIAAHGKEVTIVGDKYWGGPEGIWRGTPDSLTSLTYENEEIGEYGWYAKDGKLFYNNTEVRTPLDHVDAVKKYYATDGWGKGTFLEWPDKSDPEWRKKWLRADFYVVVDLNSHEYAYMVDGQYMIQKYTDIFLERHDLKPPLFPNGMDHDAAGAVGTFKGDRILFIGDRQFMTDASHTTELAYGNGPIEYPTMEEYTWAKPISKVVFQGNGEYDDVYGYYEDDDTWYFPSFQNDGTSTGMKGADLRVYSAGEWKWYPCSSEGIHVWNTSTARFDILYPIDVFSFDESFLLSKTTSAIEHDLYYMEKGSPSGKITKVSGIPAVNRIASRKDDGSAIARMADDSTIQFWEENNELKYRTLELPSPIIATINTDTGLQDLAILENGESWSVPYNSTDAVAKVSGMKTLDGAQWYSIGDVTWSEGQIDLAQTDSWLSGKYADGTLFFLHFTSEEKSTLGIDEAYTASIDDGFNDPAEYTKTTIHTKDTIELSRYTNIGRDALLFKRGSGIRGTRFITTSKPCETIYGQDTMTEILTQGQQFYPLLSTGGAIPAAGSTVVDTASGWYARAEDGTSYILADVARLLPEKAPEKTVAYKISSSRSIRGNLVESSWVMLADSGKYVALLSPDRKICFISMNYSGDLLILRPVETEPLPKDVLFSPADKKTQPSSGVIFVTGKEIGTLLVPFCGGSAGDAALKPLKISDEQIYAVNNGYFSCYINSDGTVVPVPSSISQIFASNSDGFLVKIYWTTDWTTGVKTVHVDTVSKHSGVWGKNGNIAWNDSGYALVGNFEAGEPVEPKWTS